MRLAADGQPREVSIGELNRATSAVVRSLTPGERLVITRHGEPQAVVLSVRDAVELVVVPRLAALAAAGERDFRSGRVETVEPPGPLALLLAQEAAACYESMNRRDRTDLRALLVRGEAEEERLLWLRSRRWLVSFTYPDAEAVLVLGVFEVAELERELVGEEVWLARARRDLERRLHARDRGRLPSSG